jgi:hypothetical protein
MPLRSYAFALLGLLAAPAAATSLSAQTVDPRCENTAIVGPARVGGDACQKVVDLYNYMNVQLGTWIAGGNATLGQGGTLGGLGHFAVELRANVMRASVPQLDRIAVQTGPAVSSAIPTKETWAGLPTADVAIGLFKGIPIGITSVGGIDALVNVSYMPELSQNSVTVRPTNGKLKLGFGGRLGILQETLLVPGLGFTYLVRDIPRTSVVASDGNGNTVTVSNYTMRTEAWRLVASKKFLIVGLAAGIGQDRYKGDATLTYDVDGVTPQAPIALSISPKRTNYFADVSANLLMLHIVGELGRVSGGDVTTYNTFEKPASDARLYGSVGVRVGF